MPAEERSKRLDDEDLKFLTTWHSEEFSGEDAEVIENYVEEQNGKWWCWLCWGFDVFGEGNNKGRRYARHVVVKNDQGAAARLVFAYDYVGKNE
jgi:hypothetical protein